MMEECVDVYYGPEDFAINKKNSFGRVADK